MAKKKQAGVEVLDAEPVNQETSLVATESAALGGFLRKLETFLVGARDIETKARATRDRFKTFVMPTSLEEDSALKDEVRLASAQQGAAETYWNITTAFSRFHKRLTAARARATGPLEEAIQIGNDLHARYLREEQRKADDRAREAQRKADEKARIEREAELDALEAKANALEEASEDLSDRENRYIDAIIRLGNAQAAAKAAGYRNPIVAAARLTTNQKIIDAITAKQQAATLRRHAEAVREMPVEADIVDEPEARVDTTGDRTGRSAVVTDEAALIAAVCEGRLGIPRDVLTIRQTKLNDYARSIGKLIERWPGVSYKEKTTIV